MTMLRVDDTSAATGWSRHGSWLIPVLVLLMLAPAGYLFVTGRSQRAELTSRAASAEIGARALVDSLDAARTQLLVDRVLVVARGGEMIQATELASRFFDRVDRRSRVWSAPSGETDARLRVLAMRDQTIAALTLADPSALRFLEEIATLHLPLGDPTLGARIPATPSSDGVPTAADSLRARSSSGRRVDTLPARNPW